MDSYGEAFVPGAIVEVTTLGWSTYSLVDVLGRIIEVGNGDLGVVVRTRLTLGELGVFIYMLDAQRTILTHTPTRCFKICHTPRDDVREAVEACVMAEEYEAAARLATDEYRTQGGMA